MNIEKLKLIVMDQAREKGFGISPDDIIVSEKIALIHSEISEAYDAYLRNIMEGKHGFQEEIGDVLQRTLHLGGIFGVYFPTAPDNEDSGTEKFTIEKKIATLHKKTSDAFENYRHKMEKEFFGDLVDLANATVRISIDYDFPIEKAIIEKIEQNKNRNWNRSELNEKLL